MQWIQDHPEFIWWTGAFSLVSLLLVLLALPWFVCRLPADYFTAEYVDRRRESLRQHSPWMIAIVIIRNLLGLVLVIAGFGMLILPGPGILTIVLGLLLLTLPGKRPLMCWLANRSAVGKALTWIRDRHNQPPFQGLS